MLSIETLPSAVAVANIPTLSCTLVHLTGDPRWIRPPYSFGRMRGMDDNETGDLTSAQQEEVRVAAIAAIGAWLAGSPPALPEPGDDLLLEMMSATLGEEIPAAYVPMIRHELCLAPPSTAHHATPSCATDVPEGFNALIIGAGISGICAAVEFAKAGVPYTIVERAENVGGVWLENRYPGAACDVPSHLYSFSFAPGRWSRHFADSREIHSYLEDVARTWGVHDHVRFGHEAIEANWDESERSWRTDVVDSQGDRKTLSSRILVSGVGAFNKPRLPEVPGLARFQGPSVHTARYPDEGLDLGGKRVVLVGNGASAMQVAPAIADEVASLTVIQRSPQWAAPFTKFQQSIPEPLRDLLDAVPLYRLWYRLRLSWAFNDKLYDALQHDPDWGNDRSINAINDAHRRQLTDYILSELGPRDDLADAVLPSFPPFAKRMLLDNGWFRTLARSHVNLVNSTVTEVHEDGLVTADGQHHCADVIIWATGFDVVNLLAPLRVRGLGGRLLHDEWQGDDARAYLGAVVPGFPNFFCLYGPNTQFGHGGSLITILERQTHYLMSLLARMFTENCGVVEIRRDVYDRYNQAVDETHARMIWQVSGVQSYFLNSKGRNVVNNPFRIIDFWEMTERADLSEYHCLCTSAATRPSAA
ncbi:flavin-containing monooxygenase [Sphingopyxis sp. FD7]|uniref:flavin-containing monooxygenase n=1 Tax=Sphingopyxis sp. FD7 TaxID=1914525 RepID=UPI000DC617D5|nr:NAD(P)/FAD-dependent oxidoreductase [Sphingopyxis sp. FD7]BBB14379.1 4-hydroxyacetophenone monooxygenase [Sphingopyxis sp. FD7]